MGKDNFTAEEEEQLADFVRQHPQLYDPSHVDYKNKSIRQQFWMQIGTELNKTSTYISFISIFVIIFQHFAIRLLLDH